MEQESNHPHNNPSSASIDAPPSTSNQLQEEEVIVRNEQTPNQQNSQSSSYRVNISISNLAPTELKDDVWSFLVVLVTFWFFASMTLILGFYGSFNLELGPKCSRLIKTNPFFVQSIKVEEVDQPKHGPMLYGFYKPPSMDDASTWTEKHRTIIPVDFHKEWVYYLNKGSKIDIFYNITSPSSSPLSLVIAQGRVSLVEWIDQPSYPNSTMFWKIITGRGEIEQGISKSANYYIAVGKLNSETVEVELNFTIKAMTYNTTNAYCVCSLGYHSCSLDLFLLETNVAVITSPAPSEGALNNVWYVKVSYGPRWITYFIGSGVLTLLILFTMRLCNMFQANNADEIQETRDYLRSERGPLLLNSKDDDVSSRGSSYDSISLDEQNLDELVVMNAIDQEKKFVEWETLNRLCVICFDSPRDCFFLPCGHCAACFTCGTRIAEEAGFCPICRRSMKKVRKIFTV